MSIAVTEATLDRISTLGGDLGRSVVAADERFALLSRERLLEQDAVLDDSYLLQRLGVRWRMQITRKGEQVILIFRRRKVEEIVLDMELGFGIEPIPPGDQIGPARPSEARYAAQLPPFLVGRATRAQLERFAPRSGAGRGNTLLFRLDPELRRGFAVVNPASKRGFELYASDRSGVVRRLEKTNRRWPTAPFLELVLLIRDWLLAGGRPAEPERLGVPAPGSRGDNELWQLLRAVAQCQRSCERVLARDGRARNTENLAESLRNSYGPNDFGARIGLRLTEAGRLALDPDDESFQLELTVDIEEDARDGPLVNAAVGLPDFLAAGEAKERLFAKLRSEQDGIPQKIRSRLARSRHGKRLEDAGRPVALDEVRDLLAMGLTPAVVFRSKRKNRGGRARRDTDLFLMRGRFGGETCLVVLRVSFDVELRPGVQTSIDELSLRKRSIEVVHFGTQEGDDEGLDDEAVDYFRKLAHAFHRWVEALA